MTVLSEMVMSEEEARKVLADIASERKAGNKTLVRAKAYLTAAGINEDKLVGSYKTPSGHKVVVIVKSTNPKATVNVGAVPTAEESQAADQLAENTPMIKMTDPNKDESDPTAELPEEI